MKWIPIQGTNIFISALLSFILFAYADLELDRLWSSISDINHPTLEDFQLIESYLKDGERPYLDPLHNAKRDESKELRLKRILNFKLIGPGNEMPIFEVHHLNENEETNKRCILLFASHNGKEHSYAAGAREVLSELEKIGYSGHVLLRIGGFPHLSGGGLKLCHIPYAFKVAFLQEAKALGYKEVLWLDTSLHPLRNLSVIFKQIQRDGYFFITPGSLQDHASHFPEEIMRRLNIPPSLYPQIPHVAATLIGLDMENERAVWFLDSWLAETEKVYPNVAFFPEELSLSLTAWRLSCKPQCTFGDVICIGHEIGRFNVFKDRPNLQFFVGKL